MSGWDESMVGVTGHDAPDAYAVSGEDVSDEGEIIAGANSRQVDGEHYLHGEIQPWDYIVSQGLGFLEGNIVKYVSRHRHKDGIEDLRKAQHYLDKLIECRIVESMHEDKYDPKMDW